MDQNRTRYPKGGIYEVKEQISSASARRSTGRTGLDEWELYDSL